MITRHSLNGVTHEPCWVQMGWGACTCTCVCQWAGRPVCRCMCRCVVVVGEGVQVNVWVGLGACQCMCSWADWPVSICTRRWETGEMMLISLARVLYCACVLAAVAGLSAPASRVLANACAPAVHVSLCTWCSCMLVKGSGLKPAGLLCVAACLSQLAAVCFSPVAVVWCAVYCRLCSRVLQQQHGTQTVVQTRTSSTPPSAPPTAAAAAP